MARKVRDSRKTTLWRCDKCGGPVNWTIIDGLPYYRCKALCPGFCQVDMFGDVGYIDRVVSVSALRDEGEGSSVGH